MTTMLLYSETLYALYLHSGDFAFIFLTALAVYSGLKFRFFKDSYFYLLITFVVYSLIEILNYGLNKNNIPNPYIGYYYSIIAIILPTIFYLKSLVNSTLNKVTMAVMIVYIAACFVQIYLSVSNKTALESPVLFPLKNLLTIVLGLILHAKLLRSPKVKSPKGEPAFWFNMGFLVINFSNLILTPIFTAVTPLSDNLAFVVGTISNLADPITYILWAIGVHKLSTQFFRPISTLWP
jgi:hypothetical protein